MIKSSWEKIGDGSSIFVYFGNQAIKLNHNEAKALQKILAGKFTNSLGEIVVTISWREVGQICKNELLHLSPMEAIALWRTLDEAVGPLSDEEMGS